MMIFYQLFIIFVIVAAANVFGINDECDLNEQLDKHYLQAAYLNPTGALYFNGTKIAEFKLDDYNEEMAYRIKAVDVVRIDVKKFALLGYADRLFWKKLRRLLVIGYENDELIEYYNQTYPDDGFLLEMKKTPYYDKDGNVLYVDTTHKFSLNNGTYEEIEHGKETCFMEDVHCVYDPYTQKLRPVLRSTPQIVTSSCNLNVISVGSKYYLTDGKENGSKFCLGTNATYQQIFLFPDFTKYDQNGCDKPVILSKPEIPTTSTAPVTTSTTTVPGAISSIATTIPPVVTTEPAAPDVNFKSPTPILPKSTSLTSNVNNAGAFGSNYEDCTQEQRNMWYGAAAAFIIALLIFIAGLAMIAIVRKGKAKKKEYMAIRNDPFAYTTKAEAEMMARAAAQDGGYGRSPIPSVTRKQIHKLNDSSSKHGNHKLNDSSSKHGNNEKNESI